MKRKRQIPRKLTMILSIHSSILLLVSTLAGSLFAGPRTDATYRNPVLQNCADPAVLRHGDLYYVYGTRDPKADDEVQGIRVYTSPDLIHWTDRGFALTQPDSWGESQFWAPDVVERDGVFYLYYAAETQVCVATSDSPLGPFKQRVMAPMEPRDALRIDAHVFKDEDGRYFLYFVRFHRGNEIWGARLNDDMVSIDASTLTRLLTPDQPWERHTGRVVEGPEMLNHKGVYYLTYSGSHFRDKRYAVGYATGDHPLGPFRKHPSSPILKRTEDVPGPGHHCFIPSPDGSELFIVYHRHFSNSRVLPRALAIDRVRFVDHPEGPDLLVVNGPTTAPQPRPAGSPSSP